MYKKREGAHLDTQREVGHAVFLVLRSLELHPCPPEVEAVEDEIDADTGVEQHHRDAESRAEGALQLRAPRARFAGRQRSPHRVAAVHAQPRHEHDENCMGCAR